MKKHIVEIFVYGMRGWFRRGERGMEWEEVERLCEGVVEENDGITVKMVIKAIVKDMGKMKPNIKDGGNDG